MCNSLPFSIVIPTYLRPKALMQAIESALAQSYSGPYEILILDNDDSHVEKSEAALVVDSLGSNKLRYVNNSENVGAFHNMNRCIELAQHEHIIMLHDDDLLDPNYLYKINNAFSRYPDAELITVDKKTIVKGVEVKKSGFHFINTTLSNIMNIHGLMIKIEPPELFTYNLIGGPAGTAFKKSKALALGGFDNDYYPVSDYIFWYEYCQRFNSYMLIDELAICQQDNNITLSEGMFPRIYKTCYQFQLSVISRGDIINHFASEYAYEAILMRIKMLENKVGSDIEYDKYYQHVTGSTYKTSALQLVKAYIFLFLRSVNWIKKIILGKLEYR